MKKLLILLMGVIFLFVACSKEEEQKLPELPKIEAPSGVVGKYVGRVPPENAKAHQVQLMLDSNGVGLLSHNILQDTLISYADRVTYTETEKTLVVVFGKNTWQFEKGSFGLLFLNPQGEPYLDASGNNFTLLRILKNPEK